MLETHRIGRPPKPTTSRFGQLIVDGMGRQKTNRREVSQTIGVSQTTLSDWVLGIYRPCKFTHLVALCDLLNLSRLTVLAAIVDDETKNNI